MGSEHGARNAEVLLAGSGSTRTRVGNLDFLPGMCPERGTLSENSTRARVGQQQVVGNPPGCADESEDTTAGQAATPDRESFPVPEARKGVPFEGWED